MSFKVTRKSESNPSFQSCVNQVVSQFFQIIDNLLFLVTVKVSENQNYSTIVFYHLEGAHLTRLSLLIVQKLAEESITALITNGKLYNRTILYLHQRKGNAIFIFNAHLSTYQCRPIFKEAVIYEKKYSSIQLEGAGKQSSVTCIFSQSIYTPV